MHGLIYLIEAFHGEEQVMLLVDFNRGRDHLFKGEVMDGAMTVNDASAFGLGADESTAVELDAIVLADDAELDGVPEDASELFENGGVGDGGANAAIVLKKACKNRMRMHRNMTEDVVEDIRLWSVCE